LSELTKRILFAVPAAALFLFTIWWGGSLFEWLMGIIAIGTVWEIHRILTKSGNPDVLFASLLIALFIWITPNLPEIWIVSVCVVALLVTIWTIIDRKTEISQKWLSSIFCGVYAPVGYLMVVHVRSLGDHMEGFWLTLALLLMIWGNDVFAYFGGKKFGKRPLAPLISPNKTWEGFWFGFLGAAVGYLIAFLLATPFPLGINFLIPAVVIVSVAGPVGDLIESRLKRAAEMKDSSNLLPGHGGLFDRFDSLIFSSPFIFFYFHFLV
jgi:phosphatidate cytidylyltransferase